MHRLTERIAALWAFAGGLLLLAIMAVTSVNTGAFALDRMAALAGRDVAGLPGYEDFVRLAVSGAALMFLPYCQQRRGHVVVDVFASRLGPRAVRALDRLWLAATAAMALYLGYWMALGLAETRADNVLSPVLGWPQWPFYLPGVLSLALWAAVAVVQAARRGDA